MRSDSAPQKGIEKNAAGGGRLVIGKVLRLIGVEQKAGGDEHEDAGAEQETAFAFQAGFTQ